MSDSLLAFFGISAAIINTVGLYPYIRDIFKRKTKPERATWWIWLALNIIAISAQISAGFTWYIVLAVVQSVAVGLIAVLSLNYGYGTFKRRDVVSFVVALFGLVLWNFTHSPITALLVVVLVDFAAFYPLLIKTWEAPHTETLSTWVLATISSTLGVIAVGVVDITRLLYPIYIALGCITMVVVILQRRPKQAN